MGLRQRVSRQLRGFESFVNVRRLQHEGFGRAYRRWRLWSSVLDLPPVQTDAAAGDSPIEVHLVCCQKDYLCALWALKSFYFTAAVTYPLIVHLNGHMTALALTRLRKHLPNARLLQQEEADKTVIDWLEANHCPRLQKTRAKNGFMLKLIDVNLLSRDPNVLLLDSDVLFFRRPQELLDAVQAPLGGSLFQRDAGSTYNVTLDEARTELGISLAPAVNTGIVLFNTDSIDLRRCEELLGHPGVARQTGWIEQTLYALVASEQQHVRYLPSTYLVSLDAESDLSRLTARHYAGPSRRYLTEEGLPFAARKFRANGVH